MITKDVFTVLASIILATNLGMASTATPQYTVTFMPESSVPWPAGYTMYGQYISQSSDPVSPFSNESVAYTGFRQQGGSQETLNGAYLVYRFRIDFTEDVVVGSVSVTGLGDYASGGSAAVLRLLDQNQTPLATLSTTSQPCCSESTYTLDAKGASGQTFFVDEFDYSTDGRFRQLISFDVSSCSPARLGPGRPLGPRNNAMGIGDVFGVEVLPAKCDLHGQRVQETVTYNEDKSTCFSKGRDLPPVIKQGAINRVKSQLNAYLDWLGVPRGIPITSTCSLVFEQEIDWVAPLPQPLVFLPPMHEIYKNFVVQGSTITVQECLGNIGQQPVCAQSQPYQ